MVNSISSMGGYQMMAASAGGKAPPPPPKDQDIFKLSDSDADGLVSQTELESLVQKIEEVTGESVDVEDALSNYDTDSNGGLSGKEMFELLGSLGFTPPELNGGSGEKQGIKPPPPPIDQALSSYGNNSGQDTMSALLDLLNSGENEEEYSSVNVTS